MEGLLYLEFLLSCSLLGLANSTCWVLSGKFIIINRINNQVIKLIVIKSLGLLIWVNVKIIIILYVLNFNVLVLEIIWFIKAEKLSITLTAISSSIFVISFLHQRWVSLSSQWIHEHACLRLKVFNLKIWS